MYTKESDSSFIRSSFSKKIYHIISLFFVAITTLKKYHMKFIFFRRKGIFLAKMKLFNEITKSYQKSLYKVERKKIVKGFGEIIKHEHFSKFREIIIFGSYLKQTIFPFP